MSLYYVPLEVFACNPHFSIVWRLMHFFFVLDEMYCIVILPYIEGLQYSTALFIAEVERGGGEISVVWSQCIKGKYFRFHGKRCEDILVTVGWESPTLYTWGYYIQYLHIELQCTTSGNKFKVVVTVVNSGAGFFIIISIIVSHLPQCTVVHHSLSLTLVGCTCLEKCSMQNALQLFLCAVLGKFLSLSPS